ncbi:hypothetical protein VW23_001905 [Devosia insulae DS-56]|uniref:Acyltransferase 3 domain-containing protein n=1 Tax=Devosia insulae DS-56 TaxID=1116389 RepID=A0A1E5XM69_9HYPH|nr:acyltransferase [Devosia insulae]OEO29669.1 hypothetical protein VW23_001905 [Devosia insulae DS-56]
MIEPASNKVADIQVLRGLAILLVLAQHLSLTRTLRDALPTHVQMPFWLGVELFFLISGVVVTQSVLSTSRSPIEFLVRRLFRLIPAILVFLAASAAVFWVASSLPVDNWGRQNFSGNWTDWLQQAAGVVGGFFINLSGSAHYLNGAMWSLSVEFQFYLAFAALLALCTRLSVSATRRVLLISATAIYALCLAQRVGLLFDYPILSDSPLTYLRQWRFDFMALGVIVACLPTRQVSKGGSFSPYLILIPLIITSLSEDIFSAEAPFLHGFAAPLTAICFAALLFLARSGYAFPNSTGWLYRSLTWIGNRSFSLYLLHFPVMAAVWIAFDRLTPLAFSSDWTYGVSQAVVTLALALPCAELCFRYVELPGQRLGKRLTARGRGLPTGVNVDAGVVAQPSVAPGASSV